MNGTDASNEVFELLKRRGPLSPSQISVELGLLEEEVRSALKELSEERIVEERPDRDPHLETPWGLRRPRIRI